MVKEYTEIKERIQQKDNLNKVYREEGKTGKSGECYEYMILNGRTGDILGNLTFQNGPRNEKGSQQGITDADLLEIVRDRFNAFQNSGLKDDYTWKALMCIEGALGFLQRRTEDRKKRGVLGTYKE